MRKRSFLHGFFGIMLLHGCNSHNSSETPVKEVDSLGYIIVDTNKAKDIFTTEPVNPKPTPTDTLTGTKAKTVVIIDKDICGEWYLRYQKYLNLYSEDKSDEALDDIFKLLDSPEFIKCKENRSYVDKFRELDKRFDELTK